MKKISFLAASMLLLVFLMSCGNKGKENASASNNGQAEGGNLTTAGAAVAGTKPVTRPAPTGKPTYCTAANNYSKAIIDPVLAKSNIAGYENNLQNSFKQNSFVFNATDIRSFILDCQKGNSNLKFLQFFLAIDTNSNLVMYMAGVNNSGDNIYLQQTNSGNPQNFILSSTTDSTQAVQPNIPQPSDPTVANGLFPASGPNNQGNYGLQNYIHSMQVAEANDCGQAYWDDDSSSPNYSSPIIEGTLSFVVDVDDFSYFLNTILSPAAAGGNMSSVYILLGEDGEYANTQGKPAGAETRLITMMAGVDSKANLMYYTDANGVLMYIYEHVTPCPKCDISAANGTNIE